MAQKPIVIPDDDDDVIDDSSGYVPGDLSNPLEAQRRADNEAKQTAEMVQHIKAVQQEEKDSDIRNWSYEKTKQYFKANPPQDMEQDVKQQRILAAKDRVRKQAVKQDEPKEEVIPDEPKPLGPKKFLGESLKALAQGVQLVPAGFESVLQVGIDLIRESAYKQLVQDGVVFGAPQQKRAPHQQARIDRNTKLIKDLNLAEDNSKRIQADWIKRAFTGKEAPDPEVFRGSFMENPSWTRAVATGVRSLPTTALGLLASIYTRSPNVGAGILGSLAGAEEYVKAREAGELVGKAGAVGLANAVGETILETVPLTGYLKGGNLARRTVRGVVQEGGEETLQQYFSNMVAQLGYDEARKLSEGVVESTVAGAFSGGLIGTLMPGKGVEISRLQDKAKAKGIDVDPLYEVAAHEVVKNKDKIIKVLEDVDKKLTAAETVTTSKEKGEELEAKKALMVDKKGEPTNPIEPSLPKEEKVKVLQEMAKENEPAIKEFVGEVDKKLGTQSKYSFKKPERILSKAERPEIKKSLPQFDVEHVRDAIRFKTKLDNVDQVEDVVRMVNEKVDTAGWEIVKFDQKKMFAPKEWGSRFSALDIRMPNGQLVEYYFMPKEMDEDAVKDPNHVLFEKWRDKTEDYKLKHMDSYVRDVVESHKRYDEAWNKYLQRQGLDESAARASFNKAVTRASSLMREKLSLRSSAEGTATAQTPPVRTAENLDVSPTQTRSPSKSSEPIVSNVSDISTTSKTNIPQGKGDVNSKKQQAVSFVSPNVKEKTTIDDAVAGIKEPGQEQFRLLSEDVDKQLGIGGKVNNAIVVWTDGAENSTFAEHSTTDINKLDYATSIKALAGNQKQAIRFVLDNGGGDMLYYLKVSDKDVKGIHDTVKGEGIPYFTIVDEDGPTSGIYVLEPGASQESLPAIERIGEKYGATKANRAKGFGRFLGDPNGESREVARREYVKEIRKYEEAFPVGRWIPGQAQRESFHFLNEAFPAVVRTGPLSVTPPAIEQASVKPIRPSKPKFVTDRGAMPGEPMMFYDMVNDNPDTARAYISESVDDQGNVLYNAYKNDGTMIGIFQTAEEAQGGIENYFNNPPGKRRKFITTVKKAEKTPQPVAREIESRYFPINNKETMAQAQEYVTQNGVEAAMDLVLGPSAATTLSNAVGLVLLEDAQQNGRWREAIDIVERIAEKNTTPGQTIQILSVYARLTPEGIMKYAVRQVQKAKANIKQREKLTNFEKLAKGLNDPDRTKLANKLGIPHISELVAEELRKLAEKIQVMEPGRERDIETALMLKKVADLVPKGLGQKVSAVQTIAQLLNPKTFVRNILGNLGFFAMENLTDVVATGLDIAASAVTGERTTYLPDLPGQVMAGITGAKQAAEEVSKGISLKRVSDKLDLPKNGVFDKGVWKFLEDMLKYSLEVPDRAFMSAAIHQSLRNQMQAAQRKGQAVNEPTAEMIEQATALGLLRTFQNDSFLSTRFRKLKKFLNDNKAWGLGDLVIKYPSTPANIMNTGIAYSPAGFVKTVYEMARPYLKGEALRQEELVRSAARASTGSALLVGTGIILAGLGIITGRRDEDRDVEAMREQAGLGDYQLNVSALKRFVLSGLDPEAAKLREDDLLVSYDWFLPASIPLALGANIALDGERNVVDTAMNLGDAILSATETLQEQPFMQGLKTVSSQGLSEIGKGMASSFVPTLLNQIRQLTDNTARNIKDLNWFKESYNKAALRVPVLAGTLPPKITTLGVPKEMYQDNSNNPFNVFLNPAFVTKYKPDPIAQMVLEVWENSGQTVHFPRVAAGSVTLNDGEKTKLTAQQYMEYQSYIGYKTGVLYEILQGLPSFQEKTDEEKAKALGGYLTDINTAARIDLFDYVPKKDPGMDVMMILRDIGWNKRMIEKSVAKKKPVEVTDEE